MSRPQSIVIAFGRFNPPTTGHASLLSFIETTAHRYRADIRVYPSQSQDAKKNPLPFQEKLRFLKTLFPHIIFNTNAAIRTPFDALADVAATGYTDVILVVGSDRVEEFSRFKKYIVPRSDPHFNKAQHIPLNSYQVIAVPTIRGGSGAAGMSASKQRAFAVAGDYDSFKQGVPGQNDHVARDLYTAVRRHMQIKETAQFRINTKMFRLPLLEAMDTFAVMAIGDASPSHKHGGYGHTPDTKVLWQMFDLAKNEVKLAAQEARRKYPTATISVENKNGKIVKVYKPGQQITETIHEARLGMPLKGHAYHTKTDAELRYIIKDAGEAALMRMRSRDPKGEMKYLDQVDDAHTVLYYRRQGGKQMKESQLREDHIRVGDRVHAGMATKGGAGFKGIVDRVEGNFVYVIIGTDKFGDRIIKAPMRTVMKEATEMISCPSCHRKVAKGAGYCPHCKQDITESELAEAVKTVNATPAEKMRAAHMLYVVWTKQKPPHHLQTPESVVNGAIELAILPSTSRHTPEGWNMMGQMLVKMDQLGIVWNRKSLRPSTLRAMRLSEATSLFGKNGAWGPAVGKAVNKWADEKMGVPPAGQTHMWRYGVLEVYDTGKEIEISYGGNMGDTEARHVAPAFDQIFGKGKFAAIRGLGKYAVYGKNTYSDPSYSYQLNVPRNKFYQIVKPTMKEESAGAMGTPKAPSETDRLKISQKQDEISLKQRQSTAMMAAKLRDIQSTARDQQAKANAPKGN